MQDIVRCATYDADFKHALEAKTGHLTEEDINFLTSMQQMHDEPAMRVANLEADAEKRAEASFRGMLLASARDFAALHNLDDFFLEEYEPANEPNNDPEF
jgi:hypothetical protein